MGLEKKDQILGNNESNSVKLKYVKLGYHYLISNAMYLFLVPLIVASAHLSVEDFVHLLNHLKLNLISVTLCTALTVFLATLYFVARPRQVYLLNFACYKPPPAHLCSKETFMDRSRQNGCSQESLEFQRKIMERSGQGQKTFEEAKKEAEMIMFGAIDQLLAKTKVNVKDIGILVVNCSLFNPTPSLSAMVVNRYKLRGNVLSYSLGGMGCSAGLISIDLAKRLLQVCIKLYPKIGYIF